MRSSGTIYRRQKFMPLVFIVLIALIFWQMLGEDNILDNWQILLTPTAGLFYFAIRFGMLFNALTEVVVSETNINLITKDIKVEWLQVKALSYVYIFGLYRIDLEEGTFYFPSDINRGLFMFESDFDELIDRKKRYYRIPS